MPNIRRHVRFSAVQNPVVAAHKRIYTVRSQSTVSSRTEYTEKIIHEISEANLSEAEDGVETEYDGGSLVEMPAQGLKIIIPTQYKNIQQKEQNDKNKKKRREKKKSRYAAAVTKPKPVEKEKVVKKEQIQEKHLSNDDKIEKWKKERMKQRELFQLHCEFERRQLEIERWLMETIDNPNIKPSILESHTDVRKNSVKFNDSFLKKKVKNEEVQQNNNIENADNKKPASAKCTWRPNKINKRNNGQVQTINDIQNSLNNVKRVVDKSAGDRKTPKKKLSLNTAKEISK